MLQAYKIIYNITKGWIMKKNKLLKKYSKISSIALIAGLFYGAGLFSGIYGDKIIDSAKQKFSRPIASFVMSTYNREKSIRGAMDSILNQTRKDFEVIVVNDGSTDSTAQILDEYAKKDPRVKVITNKKNQGLVAGLNKGLDAARGKYIIRMDDDDKSMPYRVERQVLAMEANPHIAIMGAGFAGENTPKKTKDPILTDPDEMELNMYFSSGLAHPTIIIRKSFLDENNIRYDEKYLYAEDCGLYKKVLEHGGKISSMHEGVLIFGYMKGLVKPKNYGYTQAESFKNLQKDKLAPFFDAPYEILGAFNGDVNRCIMLKEMVKTNKEKQIINHDVLTKRYENLCPKEGENTLYLMHSDWATFVVLKDDNTLYRKDVPTETGKILDQEDGYITIKWTNYIKPETYIKNQQKEYKYSEKIINKNLKGTRIFEVKHPYWVDLFIINKDKTFYRASTITETGRVIKETKNTIVIEWDNWPNEETFTKKEDKLIFLKDNSEETSKSKSKENKKVKK